MSRRTQMYLLGGLLVVLAATLYYSTRSQDSGPAGGVFASNAKFQPLDVQAPQLRVDLLDKIHKLEYGGAHRNIFIAAPPPPPSSARLASAAKPFVGPQVPPPPPPVRVPAELFGYALQRTSGKRVAFFSANDDVLVVGEGDTFLNRFRLVHVAENSADVEEISSGRHATVPMTASDQPNGSQ